MVARTAVLALALGVVLGCGRDGPSTATCERARDHALSNQQQFLADIESGSEVDRVALHRQSAREGADILARFVDVCRETPGFKADCFASPATQNSARCRPFVGAFLREVIR